MAIPEWPYKALSETSLAYLETEAQKVLAADSCGSVEIGAAQLASLILEVRAAREPAVYVMPPLSSLSPEQQRSLDMMLEKVRKGAGAVRLMPETEREED